MNEEFKFSTVENIDCSEANIFIHGYSAGRDIHDRIELKDRIPISLRNNLNIFAFWPSGHINELDFTSKAVIAGISRLHPAATLAALAVDRVAHFAKIRSKAEGMGTVLFEQLQEYLSKEHPKVKKINLIGHSLGGRLIVAALTNKIQSAFMDRISIGDVLLMAAAVEVNNCESSLMLNRINGRLINAYSKSDKILLANADETCLGRNEVKFFENVNMRNYGHSDYWPNLYKVIKKTNFQSINCTDNNERTAKLNRLIESVRDKNTDFVRRDKALYQLLNDSDPKILNEAIRHLKSSNWCNIKENEQDLAFAFTRELQGIGGHFISNFARGKGITYAEVLNLLAKDYGIQNELHGCATVIEVEEALIGKAFQSAFTGVSNPVAISPSMAAKEFPRSLYFEQVNSLSEQLTLKSYFKFNSTNHDIQNCGHTNNETPSDKEAKISKKFDFANFYENTEKKYYYSISNLKASIKPGYSALIPAIAIIFYARINLEN